VNAETINQKLLECNLDLQDKLKTLETKLKSLERKPCKKKRMGPGCVSIHIAVAVLGFQKTTIYKLLNEGKLEFVCFGNRKKVLKKSLAKLYREMATGTEREKTVYLSDFDIV
jgi:hypothetical protein